VQQASSDINNLLEPIVTGLGFEYVGALLGQAEGGLTLRVYIDSENGIDVDDCGDVSRQVSATMDVVEPIKGHYTLEVSSPGIERPLFTLAHYEQFVGERMKLRLGAHAMGRKRFTGLLQSVEGNVLVIDVDGELYDLEFDDVESGSLAPLFS